MGSKKATPTEIEAGYKWAEANYENGDAEKLAFCIQTLKDILEPVGYLRRRVPEGYLFNGHMAVRYADSPQCYKDIAKEALHKLGVEI